MIIDMTNPEEREKNNMKQISNKKKKSREKEYLKNANEFYPHLV